jgi:acetate CoA/acetoacetate CoA-transferase beta subunit
MDLVTGAWRFIVAMTHRSPSGSKVVKRCSLPITSTRRIDLLVTELAVIKPTLDGLVLLETMSGVSVREVIEASDAALKLDPKLCHQ